MRIRDRVRELRRVRAGELLPHARNWRRHPPAQAAALRGLLKELGYAAALIARETAEGRLQLIDGHLRAETTPDTIVPVLVVDLSEAEADKLLLTLDPLTGMAEADATRVAELLSTVGTDSEAVVGLLERIAVTAGCHGLIPGGAPEPEIDKAAELQVKWATARGQLWEIGPHRLLCADCRVATDVMRLWPDGGPKLRMVWTDPPYGSITPPRTATSTAATAATESRSRSSMISRRRLTQCSPEHWSWRGGER